MDKLELKVRQVNGSIELNYKELEDYIDSVVEEYRGATFTEESTQVAKAVVADLRKVAKDLDSRRKQVKAAWMKPYTDFEEKIKTLLKKFDEPIDMINDQLEEFEKKRKAEKLEQCKGLYADIVTEEIRSYLPWSAVFDDRWLNKTTTIKSIKEALEESATAVYNDLSVLAEMESDVKEEALQIYQDTRQLSEAIKHINDYEAKKARILEEERLRKEREEQARREREEAEARRREEQARRETEERRQREIQEAVEKARAEERAKLEKEQSTQAFNITEIEPEENEGFTVTDIPAAEDDLPFEQPNTRTVYFKVVASDKEIEEVECTLNSFGIYFERRDA